MTEEKVMKQSPNPNHVDYKDIMRLKGNINPHARMYNRRRTGLSAKGQRNFARAIKRARFMALVPYVSE
ncbi:MAG: small subunit ribosomal protein S18 [Patiriisocius sp.]|jgi:small subunit ribosomal protein S18